MSRVSSSKRRRPKHDTPQFFQARAQRTYEALVVAATELFALHGYDTVGTPAIADKAQVSTGSFYRYFHDKKQIYLEVVRRYSAQVLQQILTGLGPARFEGMDRVEAVGTVVDVIFAHAAASPGLLRSFSEMAARDRDIAEVQRALFAEARKRIAELIAISTPASEVADPEAMAHVLHGAVLEAAYAAGGVHGEVSVDSLRLRDTLVLALQRVLFPVGSPP